MTFNEALLAYDFSWFKKDNDMHKIDINKLFNTHLEGILVGVDFSDDEVAMKTLKKSKTAVNKYKTKIEKMGMSKIFNKGLENEFTIYFKKPIGNSELVDGKLEVEVDE